MIEIETARALWGASQALATAASRLCSDVGGRVWIWVSVQHEREVCVCVCVAVLDHLAMLMKDVRAKAR